MTLRVSLPHSSACAVRHLGPCVGRLQDHHVVKRQHIRRRHETLAAEYRRRGEKPPWAYATAISDPRLQVPVCSGIGGHHGLEATGRLQVPAHELHAGFWAAVAEYGLDPWVPKHLTPPTPTHPEEDHAHL